MSTLLIISINPTSTSKIEQIASSLGLRTQVVSSYTEAETALVVRQFSGALIDSSLGDDMLVPLAQLIWSHNPLTMAGIVNLRESISDEWRLRIMGARLLHGDGVLAAIKGVLETLPDVENPRKELGILLVDDLDSPREIIAAYIEAMGYAKVEAVDSANNALALLLNHPNQYFCIITDINMPSMNGIQFITEVRKTEGIHSVPIIVLTAYGTGENLIECIKAGATGFLVKPLRKKLLQGELDKAKRIFLNRHSPRLCPPEDTGALEEALAVLSLT